MILDDIANQKRKRLSLLSGDMRVRMKSRASTLPTAQTHLFANAVAKQGLSFIAEVKKASPSKGIICADFNPVAIAQTYEAIGIDAISVLTEQDFFLGSPEYLTAIHDTVTLPLLRKDFIIDRYQIHEAKVIGSHAILLICALLDQETLHDFYKEAQALGLDVLVEAHNKKEIDMALAVGASIIGINNRDLKTFHVDLATSEKLREFIPQSTLMVSESGYATREDIIRAEQCGCDAVLIGESFMRSPTKKELLATLKGKKACTHA